MRKLAIAAIAAIAAVITLSAAAQQPLQCLNPDILNGVIFFGSSEEKMEVTRGLPPLMSGFHTPAGLSLIGTGVRDGGIATTVAYRTSLSVDKAYAAVVTALGAEGWQVESLPGSAETFNFANGPRTGTVCRNGERRGVKVWDAARVRYVNIDPNTQARPRNCNVPDPVMNRAFDEVGSAVPRFRFPAGTTLAQGGGGGGSTDVYTSSSRVISTGTSAGLVEYLASQLQDQGWRHDADWSGAGSAGSTWRKIIDDQLRSGTLEIVRVSEQTYEVDFTMTSPPQ